MNYLHKKFRFLVSTLLVLLSLVQLFSFHFTAETKALVSVFATVETTPSLNPPDAIDDPAIWIHPIDASQSTIIGTDKPGNLEVYNLEGQVLQRIPFKTNNVDLRYNFLLNGERVTLVTGVNRTTSRIFIYKVNPATRLLEDVAATTTTSVSGLQGSAMYISPVTGKYYALFNFNGVLRQYELVDNGQGKVGVNLVRTVTFNPSGDLSEGVVADDIYGKVYVSDEAVGIWRLGAEPTDGDTKVLIDKPIAQGGNFQPDIEGLTIYYKSGGSGYLMGSSQGNGTFTVYERTGDNNFIGNFNIADGSIDKVTGTDGIDVTNFPLGPAFPNGVFIAQDGRNVDGTTSLNQNFKLVPFGNVSTALGLTMDTTWDPRLVGLGVTPTPTLTPTPTEILTPTPTPELSVTLTPTPTPTETPVVTPTPTSTVTSTPTVTLSPTMTPTPTPVPSVLIFTPIADSHVNSNAPTKNFGTDTVLRSLSSPIRNSFMKFNLSGVAGREVISAKLRVYNTDSSDFGGALMFVPDNSWLEGTLTWNNAPAVSGGIVSSLGSVVKDNWYEFSILPLVTVDGQLSVRIHSTSTNAAAYYSKEGTSGLRPYLEVVLNE